VQATKFVQILFGFQRVFGFLVPLCTMFIFISFIPSWYSHINSVCLLKMKFPTSVIHSFIFTESYYTNMDSAEGYQSI